MKFKGKCAVITGAGRGIGRAVALQMADLGADLVICDIDEKNIKDVEAEVLSLGANALSLAFDVTSEKDVNSMVKQAEQRFGKIDILVNNAGIYNTHDLFVDSAPEDWRKKVDVNIFGTMLPTKAVLPSMIKNRYGRIINIGSVAGVYGISKMVDYSMTKGAIISFTKALAKEVTEYGITVNTVSPGNIAVVQNGELPDYSFAGRSGTPDELANVVTFLASDEASYVSGQNYIVDGCRKKM